MPLLKTGILLVNLGTPDAPTPSAVRRFLKQFLSDPRVIDLPRLPWRILLNLIILPLRSPKVAKNYQRIWWPEGAPLRVLTQRLASKLQIALNNENNGSTTVLAAMQYGSPSLIDGLLKLQEEGVSQIKVFPLYPQYSTTTTAAVLDAINHAQQKYPNLPSIQVNQDYHAHPTYIEALANTVRQHWAIHSQAQKLIISFHGIPKRYADAGDPYPQQCETTAQLLAEALGLKIDEWLLCYQSRFGKAEWLKPYAVDLLQELPASGVTNIDIISPGFAVDCLETLEELAIANKKIFMEAGGQKYAYIPALNDTPGQVGLLEKLICKDL